MTAVGTRVPEIVWARSEGAWAKTPALGRGCPAVAERERERSAESWEKPGKIIATLVFLINQRVQYMAEIAAITTNRCLSD